MKNILLTILGMIILTPQLSFAEEEIVWRTGIIGIIKDVEISGNKQLFYSPFGNNIQIRSVESGELVDSINFEDTFTTINSIALTLDNNYMAIAGNNPYLIIWDLENNQEYKRLTKTINEEQSAQFWKSISI